MRYRNLTVLLAVLLLITCSSKPSSDKASEVFTSGLKLTDQDKVEVTGTSSESDSVSTDEAQNIRRAMKEISIIATSLADYVTDKATPPANSGEYKEGGVFHNSLVPLYVKVLPIKDPWGNNYLAYCGLSVDGQYGITGSAADDFLIVSHGKDGLRDEWQYNTNDPVSGLYTERDGLRDLVSLNGSFIRAPRAGSSD